MTDTTSKWMEGVRRSWLLKLAWVFTPLLTLIVIAALNHAFALNPDTAGLLAHLVFGGGGLIAFVIGWTQRPARRARLRALSPLQRMQMSDAPYSVPLHETLRIDDKPPVEALPPFLQSAMAKWGRPVPRVISSSLDGLAIALLLTAFAMAAATAPLETVSRWLDRPLPLSYWPTFAALMTVILVIGLWSWLRRMHDHYVSAAETTGRRPFPAAR